MEIVASGQIGKLGRIVIPVILREQFDLQTGTFINFAIEDNKLFIVPTTRQKKRIIKCLPSTNEQERLPTT